MTPEQKQVAIEAFDYEWTLRELLMKAKRFGKRAIAKHRKEILRRYQLTEKDVKCHHERESQQPSGQ